jgi:hypothetical protein
MRRELFGSFEVDRLGLEGLEALRHQQLFA